MPRIRLRYVLAAVDGRCVNMCMAELRTQRNIAIGAHLSGVPPPRTHREGLDSLELEQARPRRPDPPHRRDETPQLWDNGTAEFNE